MDPEQRVWREESCYEQMSREMREELMRLRDENTRLRDGMKQILEVYNGIQDSYTRLLLIRDIASKSPHGD